MTRKDTIRAWKDEDFRNSLNDYQKSQLQDSPIGFVELSDEALSSAAASHGCSCTCCSCCCHF